MSAAVSYPRLPGPEAPEESWVHWANGWPSIVGLGMTCTSVGEGCASFEVTEFPFPLNPNGTVNGGVLAAMVDQAMGVVSARACEPGYLPKTGSLHVQYHLPLRVPLVLHAQLLPGGRRTHFVEVLVRDASGARGISANGTMVCSKTGSASWAAPSGQS